MDTCPKVARSHDQASLPNLLPLELSPGNLDQLGPGTLHLSHTCGPTFSGHAKHRDAALWWHQIGLQVIPVVPKTKRTACAWSPWLKRLSNTRILQHWIAHPDHEVGFIVGDQYVVMDADSDQAVHVLRDLEMRYKMSPSLIVKTARGEHHFFTRDVTLPCKTTSLVVGGAQDRIDLKTGRTMVVLAPSTNKSILKMGVSSMVELNQASRGFLEHFGAVSKPDAHSNALPCMPREMPGAIRIIFGGLKRLDPDCTYSDWLRIAAITFHVSRGSGEGFRCFDSWSATGRKYKGVQDTKAKWKSFRLDHPRPLTMASFRYMLEQQGHDWLEVCAEADCEEFQLLDDEGVQ